MSIFTLIFQSKNYFLFFLLFLLTFFSCSSNKIDNQHLVQPAFYHWQTNFNLSDFEKKHIKEIQAKKLYIKFFDVDWDGKQAIPKASLLVENPTFDGEIIPTIFIANRTFSKMKEAEIENLAIKIHTKINNIFKKFPNQKLHEIQFDCDWTKSTKTKYFLFLEDFKKQIKSPEVILSATIRLHQIKFFKRTGVPPVKRGMLMFYNTGKLKDWETENSILEISTAKQYLINFDKYPLNLDLALPLFHWGILFRDDKLVRILNNLKESQLEDNSKFKRIEDNRFLVLENTYLAGHYVYEGDKIRLEKIDEKILEESVSLLKNEIQNKNITLAFYHIDSLVIQNFGAKKINNLIENLTNN